MDKHKILGSILLASSLILSMATLGWSDEDKYWGKKDKSSKSSHWEQNTGVAVITNNTYKNECSACHFAYPAGFLPERSWVKIMANLEDHFGENAELDQETTTEITNYLRGHAADKIPNRFSRSILRSIEGKPTPLRISSTDYFRHEHDEIPKRMVQGNSKVRSFSNCQSCHSTAQQGIFNEYNVHIPGFGNWED